MEAIKSKKLEHFKADHDGRLAMIIASDQVARTCFKGTPKAFELDSVALSVSKEIYGNPNVYKDYRLYEKIFILMPFMHSENLKDQETSVKAFTVLKKQAEAENKIVVAAELAKILGFAEKSKGLIERFGRFPSRNEALGRQSTKEELDFLQTMDQ